MESKIRLKEILQEKKMSGSELARRLGVTPAYIHQCVTGAANISIKQLSRIADILDVPMASFFYGYQTIEKPFYCPHCGEPLKIKIS